MRISALCRRVKEFAILLSGKANRTNCKLKINIASYNRLYFFLDIKFYFRIDKQN